MVLISGRPKNVSGTCVACVMEGSRPILAEVQGLVVGSAFGNPRRTSNGFDIADFDLNSELNIKDATAIQKRLANITE